MVAKEKRLSLKFSADEWLRRELDRRRVRWEPNERVDLAQVDSEDNEFQTRSDVHTADARLVSDYVERSQAGDEFPEVLLAVRSGVAAKHKIVCGKHRVLMAIKRGATSINALVCIVRDEEDVSRLRDISIHDNVRNGSRVWCERQHEQIAQEAIRENGGYERGYPSHEVMRSVMVRHGIRNNQSVRKHLQRLLFNREAARRRLVAPASVDACALAYHWADREGFDELVRTVCRNGDSKALIATLRDAKHRRLGGTAAASAVMDAAAGYHGKEARSMRPAEKVRLRCLSVVKTFEEELSSVTVTAEDLGVIEKAVRDVQAKGEAVVATLKKKIGG